MQATDVSGEEGESFGFCDAYRTAAYTNSVGIAMGIAAILTVFITLSPLGSRQSRDHAWKLASGLQGAKLALSLVCIILIARLYDRDDRFYAGSKLSTGFVLSCCAAGIDLCLTTALVVAGISGFASRPSKRQRGYGTIASESVGVSN